MTDDLTPPTQAGSIARLAVIGDRAGHRGHDDRTRWVDLQERQTRMLRILIAAPDRVFTKQELARALYSTRTTSATRSVDTLALRLRIALEQIKWAGPENVWGVGYRLGQPQEAPSWPNP